MSKTDFANANFLIYSQFQTVNKIGGSLLIDCAMTEEEAKTKVRELEEKHAAFDLEYPFLMDGTQKSVVYITNQAHWWSR